MEKKMFTITKQKENEKNEKQKILFNIIVILSQHT